MALKGTFSERQGLTPVLDVQIKQADHGLRTDLWNFIVREAFYPQRPMLKGHELGRRITEAWWCEIARLPMNGFPTWTEEATKAISAWILKTAPWNEVYDFLEVCRAAFMDESDLKPQVRREIGERFEAKVNEVLEANLAGYRFIDGEITTITSPIDVEAVEGALAATDQFAEVRKHLRNALALLSDRDNPDFTNSIKESISAVEGVCRIVLGDPSVTMGDAIKRLKDRFPAHGAFLGGMSQLYGWTSDTGIRHTSKGELDPDLHDAQFMLVLCSGFVSYMLGKASTITIANTGSPVGS